MRSPFAPAETLTTPISLQKNKREAVISTTASKHVTYASFDDLLEGNQTRAFLVIHNDTIVYERYFGHISETTLHRAFSMSKTYTTVLVAWALKSAAAINGS